MRYLIFLLIFSLYSCNKKEGLELQIINKEFVSNGYKHKWHETDEEIKAYEQKALNRVQVSLTNHDDVGYYFNLMSISNLGWKLERKEALPMYICFYDEEGKNVKVGSGIRDKTEEYFKCTMMWDAEMERWAGQMGYKWWFRTKYSNEHNFFIRPGETVYLESSFFLPFGGNEFMNMSFVKGKNYYAAAKLVSDTTSYKQIISKADQLTIKENGYKIYHGIITSNQIPIKITK